MATQIHIQVPSTLKPTEGEENCVREACNLDLVGAHVTCRVQEIWKALSKAKGAILRQNSRVKFSSMAAAITDVVNPVE